jgi:hypothetical protein
MLFATVQNTRASILSLHNQNANFMSGLLKVNSVKEVQRLTSQIVKATLNVKNIA